MELVLEKLEGNGKGKSFRRERRKSYCHVTRKTKGGFSCSRKGKSVWLEYLQVGMVLP